MRRSKKKNIKSSIRFLQVSMVGMFLILIGRLFQLQILDYKTYYPLSKKNTIRQEFVSPARGLIYDRDGNLLVDNEPIYTITITPANYKMKNTPLLANLLGVNIDDLKEQIKKAQDYSWYRKSRLYTDIDFQVFSRIEQNLWRLPGIGHQIESKRNYPTNAKLAHVLGYLREISEDNYNNSDHYQLGDKVGKSGLEQVYEKYLRGEAGTSYKLVNAYGQELGAYDEGSLDKPPIKGANLYTSIDTSLQITAEKLMQNKEGGIVALDPNNGSVLAMVSSPEYDLSKLAGRLDKKYWQGINSDTTAPLFNRAIAAQQPPGSTVKPLFGLIGLKLGVITPKTIVYCNGGFFKGRLYKCDGIHGNQDLVEAIQNSCNTYFFSLMNKEAMAGDLDKWHDMAADFGLGQINHIDLPGEKAGIFPDSAYFNHTFGYRKWSIGDVINLGIGQGVISVSPLQMATVAAELANGGYRIHPHIVEAIQKSNNQILRIKPYRKKISWVNEHDLDIIKEGMRRVVTDGTARWYTNIPGIKLAGKTGTAQNPHGKDHAWFICFAPYEHPKIAIAVLVENAGFGSTSAVPIASLLVEKYLTGTIKRKWLYNMMLKFNPATANEQEPK